MCESNYASNNVYFFNFARRFSRFYAFFQICVEAQAANIKYKKVSENNVFALFPDTLARKERFELSLAF